MRKSQAFSKYEMFGRASLIPGMRYMIEQMQAELNRMTAMLQGFQEVEEPSSATVLEHQAEEAPEVKNGRATNYWAKMSPQQRSKEMKRRMGMGKLSNNRNSKNMKGYWAKMTPEERQAEMVRRMNKRLAKQGAKKTTVKLERAA